MAGAAWDDPIDLAISDDGGDFVQLVDVTNNYLHPGDGQYSSDPVNKRISWWRYLPASDGTIEVRLNFSKNQSDQGTAAVTTWMAATPDVATQAALYGSTHYIADFEWLEVNADVVHTRFTVEAGLAYYIEANSSASNLATPLTVQMIATGAPATVDFGPTVVLDPIDKAVKAGASVAMTSLGYGRPMPSLQWQKDHGPEFIGPHDWLDIAGATASPYFFTASIDDDKMRYRAKFTSPRGVVYSDPATLTVTANLTNPDVPGESTAPPASGTNPNPLTPVPPDSRTLFPTPANPAGPGTEPVAPGTGSATLLEVIRAFSSAAKRAVRITGPASIEIVDADAGLPDGWTEADAANLYSSTTRELKSGTPQLSMDAGDLAMLVVGSTFVTNDARILQSAWRAPDPLPVFGVGSAPVQRMAFSFTPTTFQATAEFFVASVPTDFRRH